MDKTEAESRPKGIAHMPAMMTSDSLGSRIGSHFADSRPPWIRLGGVGMLGALCIAQAACNNAPAVVANKGLGMASAKIELIPPGTDCIIITVVGTSTVTDQYNVQPETSATFDLTLLPLGSDTFTASSYSMACSAVTASTVPTYTSNSVTATVTGSTAVDVALEMGGNTGNAAVTISFPTLANSITETALGDIPANSTISGTKGPWGIAAGPDGNIWFTESAWGEIGQITLSTGAISEISNEDLGPAIGGAYQAKPEGITAGPDGNLWYVNNSPPYTASQETQYTTSYVTRLTLPSQGAAISPASFASFALPAISVNPTAITAGPDGNLWYSDHNDDVSLMPTNGDITSADVFNVSSGGEGINGIAVGSDGNIWSIDSHGQFIYVTSTSGVLLLAYIIIGETPASCSCSITAGADGNIWFTTGNSLGMITPGRNTYILYPIPTAGSQPAGITAGPDGNIWFTENAGNNIGRITLQANGNTPQYTISEFAVPTPGAQPLGITAGPDGNIWFTEYAASKIGTLAIF